MGEVVAKALADTHPDLKHVADSPYLRDIVRLDELVEQAAKTNPNTRGNKKAVKEGALSAEAVQERHQELMEEIDRLTAPYLATGYLRKNTAKFSYGSEIGVAAAKSLQSFFASAAGNHTMDVLNGLGINPQSQSYRANFLEIPAGSLSGKPSSLRERSAIRETTLNSLSPPTEEKLPGPSPNPPPSSWQATEEAPSGTKPSSWACPSFPRKTSTK